MSLKYQKDPRENQWNFITSVECKVKHSQRSGISQSFFFGDKIRHAKFAGIQLYSAILQSEC